MTTDYISYLLSLESKGIKLGLERTTQLFNACKNPHKNFPSIQVIGTNGKGSTSAMIANILKTAGYKVGLYTSPHLVNINERIRINGVPIQDKDIIEFVIRYKDDIETLNSSFFEAMTAIAIWYFNKRNVDIAILETGLGGRLDSVTACESQLLICTSISKDHQHILGSTIEKIAYEKICALKDNMLCISKDHQQSIKNIFDNHAQLVNATIQYVSSNNHNQYIQLKGKHQSENAALAIQGIKALSEFTVNNHAIKKGLSSVNWPARIQKIHNQPNVYYDVAHNEASFESLCNYINTLKGQKILILALQQNKTLNNIINSLENSFDQIFVTQSNVRNYTPALELSQIFSEEKTHVIIDLKKAIKLYQQYPTDANIVIAGSHYLGAAISQEFKISFDNI